MAMLAGKQLHHGQQLPLQADIAKQQWSRDRRQLHLKVHTPALWMSKALNEVDGRFKATHSSALRIDLWVTTRCCVPSASRISA